MCGPRDTRQSAVSVCDECAVWLQVYTFELLILHAAKSALEGLF